MPEFVEIFNQSLELGGLRLTITGREFPPLLHHFENNPENPQPRDVRWYLTIGNCVALNWVDHVACEACMIGNFIADMLSMIERVNGAAVLRSENAEILLLFDSISIEGILMVAHIKDPGNIMNCLRLSLIIPITGMNAAHIRDVMNLFHAVINAG